MMICPLTAKEFLCLHIKSAVIANFPSIMLSISSHWENEDYLNSTPLSLCLTSEGSGAFKFCHQWTMRPRNSEASCSIAGDRNQLHSQSSSIQTGSTMHQYSLLRRIFRCRNKYLVAIWYATTNTPVFIRRSVVKEQQNI